MNRSVLFMVTSNPLQSHCPSEAVRVAAGILPWKKLKVQIYLHRPFVEALLNRPEDIKGIDCIQRYFPILGHEPMTAYGPEDLKNPIEWDGHSFELNPLSKDHLDRIRAQCTWMLHY